MFLSFLFSLLFVDELFVSFTLSKFPNTVGVDRELNNVTTWRKTTIPSSVLSRSLMRSGLVVEIIKMTGGGYIVTTVVGAGGIVTTVDGGGGKITTMMGDGVDDVVPMASARWISHHLLRRKLDQRSLRTLNVRHNVITHGRGVFYS